MVTGFANLYANSNIENASHSQSIKALNCSTKTSNQDLNHPVFNSLNRNEKHETYSEFIDEENFEEDDEEEKLKNLPKPFYFNCPISAIFYAQLLAGLNCELKENNQRYIFNYSKTSIRLHAKFQVFII